MYNHDINEDEMEVYDQEPFDLDTPVYTILAHYTKQRGTQMTGKQWYELSTEYQTAWDFLSPAGKTIILKSPQNSHGFLN